MSCKSHWEPDVPWKTKTPDPFIPSSGHDDMAQSNPPSPVPDSSPMPIAVLISGGGRTLRNILDRVDAGGLPVAVRLVVSSTPRARGLQFAEKSGIAIEVVQRNDFDDDEMPEVVEGEVKQPRTVILEFPSREAFRAWYDSDAYQAILPLRLESAPSTLIVVNALPSE